MSSVESIVFSPMRAPAQATSMKVTLECLLAFSMFSAVRTIPLQRLRTQRGSSHLICRSSGLPAAAFSVNGGKPSPEE